MADLEYANNDLVTVAFLRAVLGQTGGVGTDLPGDTTSWAGTGFAQITVIGGSSSVYARKYNPVIEVKATACVPNSGRPPWNLASKLAERIRVGCFGAYDSPVEAILPAGYERAFVQSAYLLNEPRRIPGSDSSFAVYQFDLQVNWVPEGVG